MSVEAIEELAEGVMQLLLTGDTPQSEQLRTQYEASSQEIERSDAGFFVHFDVPDDVEPIQAEERIVVRGVYATMDRLDHGMDFLLFVDDGRISMLEGYTHQEGFDPDKGSLEGVELVQSNDDSGASNSNV